MYPTHKIIALFIFLFLGNQALGQRTAFDSLLKNQPSQAAKVKAYKEGGIELDMENNGITPTKFVHAIRKYLGSPYRFGGTSAKTGFDCSGLIMTVFKDLGLKAPHNSHELGRYGRMLISQDQLLPGDMLFFTKTYSTSNLVSHAGFYVGNGIMIHASSKSGVIESKIDDPYYWNKYYIFSTRIFTERESVLAAAELKAEEAAAEDKTPPAKPAEEPKVVVATEVKPVDYSQTGQAGLYDKSKYKKLTATKEKYKASQYTAAHAKIPLNSLVRVTNTANKKSVTVRIIDRGPKTSGAIIDLSKKAWKALGAKKKEKIKVTLEVVK